MGTRTGKMVVLLVVLCLGLCALAWAEEAVEEEVAVAAPAAPQMVAQAPAVVPAPAPVVPPEMLGVTQNAKGTVYFYDDRQWEVWATIGAMNGLRPTAQVEFERCGRVIATGTVKAVRDADCVITPCPGTPAGQILLGDDVHVCLNGTRAALDKVTKRDQRLLWIESLAFSLLVWWPSL